MPAFAPFAPCWLRPAWWATWLVTAHLAWTQLAASQPTAPFDVQVTCSVLSEGDRAALVARLTGELLLSPITGTLGLDCTNSELTVKLQIPGDAFVHHSQLNNMDDPVDVLYQLGLAVIELGLSSFEASRNSFSLPSQLESTSAPAHDLSSNSPPAPAPALVPRLDPVSAARPRESFPSDRRRDTQVSTVPRDRSTSSHRARPVHLKYFLGLQLSYQHWGTEITGAVGPEVAVGATLKHIGFELSWTPFFGGNRIQDYSVRDMRWAASATARPFSWLRVGLGPLLSWVNVTGPQQAVEGDTHSLRSGLLVFGEGILARGPVDLMLSAGLSAITAARVVEQDGERVVKVPWLQPLIGAGVRYIFDPNPTKTLIAK